MKEHAADAPTLSRWQPGQDVSIRGADPLMTAVRLGYVDSPTSDAQLLTISRRPPAHFGGVNSQDSAAEGPLSPRPLASDASIRTAAPSTVLHQQGQKKRGVISRISYIAMAQNLHHMVVWPNTHRGTPNMITGCIKIKQSYKKIEYLVTKLHPRRYYCPMCPMEVFQKHRCICIKLSSACNKNIKLAIRHKNYSLHLKIDVKKLSKFGCI